MIRNQKGISIIEVLGSLAIILFISLGSGAITQQVLKTSKKSKTVALAIALESALLESIDNPDQEGYRIGGDNLREKLRLGQPPAEIELWSSFGTDEDTTDTAAPTADIERKLLYKIALAPTKPEPLYVDETGAFVTEDDRWVLRLIANYKRLPPQSGEEFPQYAIAYQISSHPKDASFRPFGSKSDEEFTSEDFSYPISQLLYIAQENSYTTSPGTCDVDHNKVISLYSVNLETGKTYCVLKGNECGGDEISVGISPRPPQGEGHFYLDLECVPVYKCSCKDIPGKNWVIDNYNPSKLIGGKNQQCGDCKFAARNNVDARVPSNSGTNSVSEKVCPSENYMATNVICRSTITGATAIGQSVTPPDVDPCASSSEPSGSETFSGSGIQGSPNAVCDRSNDSRNNGCWEWNYEVQIIEAKCVLTGDKAEPKAAVTK